MHIRTRVPVYFRDHLIAASLKLEHFKEFGHTPGNFRDHLIAASLKQARKHLGTPESIRISAII